MMRPAIGFAALALALSACGGSGPGAQPSPAPSGTRAISVEPTRAVRGSPLALDPDASLEQGVRYRTPDGYVVGVSFTAPGADWYGFAREGAKAFQIRQATAPGTVSVLGTIEVAVDAVSAGDAIAGVRAARNARFGPAAETTVGGRPAVRLDGVPVEAGEIEFSAPPALAGYVTPRSVRVYVIGVRTSSVVAVISAGNAPFEEFALEAERVVQSFTFA